VPKSVPLKLVDQFRGTFFLLFSVLLISFFLIKFTAKLSKEIIKITWIINFCQNSNENLQDFCIIMGNKVEKLIANDVFWLCYAAALPRAVIEEWGRINDKKVLRSHF
jgi:hypothetical protein